MIRVYLGQRLLQVPQMLQQRGKLGANALALGIQRRGGGDSPRAHLSTRKLVLSTSYAESQSQRRLAPGLGGGGVRMTGMAVGLVV
jgi:hypothetical protein